MLKNVLCDYGINDYARVSDKSKSINRRLNISTNPMQTFDSHQLTLRYNIDQRPSDNKISFKDAYEGKKQQRRLPKEYHEFTYNAGIKKFHAVHQGSQIPIIFLPDRPGAVAVLNEKRKMKSNSRFISSIFLLGCSLLCFFFFMQYLITGKTI